MTGKQIYILASAHVYERDGEDADNQAFSIPFLNIKLQECLPVENSNRQAAGRELLPEAPWVESLDADIDYAPSLTRVALPYALAARYFKENMDTDAEQHFELKYSQALSAAGKWTPEPVTDVYGG